MIPFMYLISKPSRLTIGGTSEVLRVNYCLSCLSALRLFLQRFQEALEQVFYWGGGWGTRPQTPGKAPGQRKWFRRERTTGRGVARKGGDQYLSYLGWCSMRSCCSQLKINLRLISPKAAGLGL